MNTVARSFYFRSISWIERREQSDWGGGGGLKIQGFWLYFQTVKTFCLHIRIISELQPLLFEYDSSWTSFLTVTSNLRNYELRC
jgi:hypothetical protein